MANEYRDAGASAPAIVPEVVDPYAYDATPENIALTTTPATSWLIYAVIAFGLYLLFFDDSREEE